MNKRRDGLSRRHVLMVVAGLSCLIILVFRQGIVVIANLLPRHPIAAIGFIFSLFFLLYAAKYYGSIFIVLIDHHDAAVSCSNNPPLQWKPFVSVHLPLYNEERVVNRLLQACAAMNYENYEVIVADDSNDRTVAALQRWANHPKIKVHHRTNRQGFKGGALAEATRVMAPQTEWVLVLDADFVPPPNLIQQFLQILSPFVTTENQTNPTSTVEIAAVQGYQWHIINARENWISRAIRCEFSGSYFVERQAQEQFGSLKAIAGSVFMIRADVLRQLGWGTSITEDWELTLRLYSRGYKVLFEPRLKAPGECISTIRQLIRQRIRWAEGHTFNVKRFFVTIVKSPKVTFREKLEFLYYAAYYLKDSFYLLGTTAWLAAMLFSRQSLPGEAALMGWLLLICNALALPMMSLAGLFLEDDARRYPSGVFYQIILTHLLVPFQAYASLKGLLENRESGWHRTFKSGRITETFKRIGLI